MKVKVITRVVKIKIMISLTMMMTSSEMMKKIGSTRESDTLKSTKRKHWMSTMRKIKSLFTVRQRQVTWASLNYCIGTSGERVTSQLLLSSEFRRRRTEKKKNAGDDNS